MAKRKRTKNTNNYPQNTTQKTRLNITNAFKKTGDELGCFGRISSFCSTSDTRRVNLGTNPVISSHERGKDRKVLTTSGTYPWSFVTHIFHNGQPGHGGDIKFSK